MNEMVIEKEVFFAECNGVDIAYQTFGDSANPAILLVMGLGGMMHWWADAWCQQLADNQFFVIRFDNRDVGQSTILDGQPFPKTFDYVKSLFTKRPPKAHKNAYTLTDMANDAVGLLDSLNIEKAHWVGMSMGGMIVQSAVISHPTRFLTLTSIMSTTGDPKLARPRNDMLKMLLTPSPTEREAYIDYHVNIHDAMNGDIHPIDPEHIRQLSAINYDIGLHGEGTARQLGAVVVSGDRTEALRNVSVPSLVIHGDNDPLVPVDGGYATADAIPNAKLHIVKGMGHGLPKSVSDEVTGQILAHISVE